ncbi:hypothetical protein [Sphingobacterium sp. T2]|uniref:hypothetical protein n=1 Tax=Sphingobacterium sp. T2 TaxID=1590596 RepID=UPI0012E000E0|nr:hypothetical protein [Sphingobacterium sp. T2]
MKKAKKENAILQNAVLDRDLKMAKQRALVVGMTVLGICTMAFFLYWNDKKKKQLRLEAENIIKENKLKTSKKVHDVVANGIYRVMSEIEYGEELDREDMLDKLEVLYEKSKRYILRTGGRRTGRGRGKLCTGNCSIDKIFRS